MTGKNKTPLIGWHPSDPTLKQWVKDEASRRGIRQRQLLDEVLEKHRKELSDENG